MAKHQRKLPAWLVGLMIAVVVTLVAFLVFSALGFGDDPVVESLAISLG
jgi:heme/copper-type cytochrome/quinol oxidase subunit 4